MPKTHGAGIIPTGEIELLRLLHFADSAIPIGGTPHSYGLETLADEGTLTPENVEIFLSEYLQEGGALDAVFVRRSWNRINNSARDEARTSRRVGNWFAPHSALREFLKGNGDLQALSEELSARKPARESRDASLKLGRRFAELVNQLTGTPLLPANLHYCIAFGAAGASLRIPEGAVALAYLNQSIMGLVSACQRLMPLGQLAASRILWNLKPAIAQASRSEEASCFSPYLELASMRHGSLETRLFIS